MLITIAEPTEFIKVNPANIGATPVGIGGMYYFYDKFGDVIYIGKTKSFRNRFVQHRRGSYFFRHVTFIKAFPVKREVDRDIYETYFINVYRPQYNVGKKWEEAPEIEYIELLERYEEEIIEIEAEISELREVFEEYDNEFSEPQDDWDYANERDKQYAELGGQLYAAERLKELRKRLRKVKSKRDSVKSFVK